MTISPPSSDGAPRKVPSPSRPAPPVRGVRPRFSLRFLRAAALPLAVLFALFSAPAAGAVRTGRKTVRVPYQAFNRQMLVDDGNKPVAGYAYDYIQTIATYAGWNVEFVPAGSFADCLERLAAGEVDLFYDVSWTEERARDMLFPDDPMGQEYYYLYAEEGNDAIVPDDYSTLQGRTVGVTRGTILPDLLRRWAEKRNIDFKIVEFDEISDKEAALHAGEIDLDMELSMLAERNLSAVEKIATGSYYLAVNKDRPDLLEDIDFAVEKILNNDLYYFSRLQERYFSDTVLSRTLTTEEKKWLETHRELRIGFFDRYLPFSAVDESGRPVGAAIDAIREFLSRLGLDRRLEVRFIRFDNQEKGYRAVESGEIDMMFPAYVSGSVREDYRVIGGKAFATLDSEMAFLADSGFDPEAGGTLRIGVNRQNLMQNYYSRDCNPGAEIVYYDDIDGCLSGLLDGTSDVTYLNSVRAAALLRPDRYRPLRSLRGRDEFQLRMAFAEDNVGLMLLMDRGLSLLESDFLARAAYAYMGRIYKHSVIDYLLEHLFASLAAVAILTALFVMVFETRLRNRKLAGANEALVEYAQTIEEQGLQEAALRKQLEKSKGELENALRLAQAANRAKTVFLSNMSHDIRTPMNAIIGFTGLATSHLDDPEHLREYLKTIAESSDHLLSLIDDVLDMSRIESGKMVLSEKPESLSGILHALRDIVRADMQAKGHRFSIDAAGVRAERVVCDKVRLHQVLFNLLSNAIKYTHPGGTIVLSVSQAPASAAGRAAFVFRCRDNGIGMAPEFAETVFESFAREANSTVSGIQGTGLGMAIAKNIVEMMGGTISVASKKGEGTEFTVSLEFATADPQPSAAPVPELQGLRALAAGGGEDAAGEIASMLRDAGMRAEGCAGFGEAVSRAEEARRLSDPFRVLVVDGRKAEANGLDAVRRLREAAGEGAAAVLIASCEWLDIAPEAKRAGVDGFLPEPVFPSDLRRAVLRARGAAADAGQDTGEERTPSLAGRKILMVDDSPMNLKIGVLLLRERGAEVDTAVNGKIALDTIREKGTGFYDFVVMDVQMPVMDGYEATAAIRKLPGGEKVKIIAFSANAFAEDREKSRQAGMDGHIAKPLKIKPFLAELRRFAG